MITLSEPNCTDLGKGIRSLTASFRRLRQRSWFKQRVFGGCFVIEIKGRPGSWHPHIHALTYCKFLDWERLLSLWRKVSTGQSVYITRVRKNTHISYLTKYITKPDCPPDLLPEVNEGIKGTRWMSPFGGCYAISQTWEVEKATCPDCGQQALFGDFTKTSTDVQLWLDYVFRQKSYENLSYKQNDDDLSFEFGANQKDTCTRNLFDAQVELAPF